MICIYVCVYIYIYIYVFRSYTYIPAPPPSPFLSLSSALPSLPPPAFRKTRRDARLDNVRHVRAVRRAMS